MNEPTTKRAGGCFIMAAILIGFAVGMVTGFGAQSYVLALQALVGRLRAG